MIIMKRSLRSYASTLLATATLLLALPGQNLLAQPFGEGAGTDVEPYQISTIEHLNAIRGEYLDDHFLLTTDLDFSGHTYADPEKGWLPIGHDTDAGENDYQGAGFRGSFGGAGHVIRNLRVNRGEEDYVGLFGRVDSGSIVSLGLEDLEVTGGDDVGGLTGSLFGDGMVTGCFATGNVTGGNNVGGLVGDIDNDAMVKVSFVTGNVTGDYYVGGLVGDIDGTVTDSYATGNVTGNYYVGGLVGQNRATVSASYATGSVTGEFGAGGLVGYNGDTVTDSYWNTELSGQATSFGGVGLTTDEMFVEGSFAGFDFKGTTDSDDNAVASVWLPPVSGQRFPHLRGVPKNGQVLSIPRVGVIPGSAPFLLEHTFLPPTISGQAPVFSGGADGVATIDGSTGSITLAVEATGGEEVTITVRRAGNGDYASISRSQTLTVGPFGGGTGTSASPWQIRTLAHLNAIRDRRGEAPAGASFLYDHFILMNDLEFAGYVYDSGDAQENAKGWLPIGRGTGFRGSFDGAGHVIRNLHIDRGGERYVGLFGRVDGGSIVSLGLEDLEVTGNREVGGLTGSLFSDGMVTGCYATGGMTGNQHVGGLVGYHAAGTVTSSYATGSVTGDQNVGGLAGYIAFGTVTSSYATGSVTGDEDVGGLVGHTAFGMVTSSYATGSVTGDEDVGGLAGSISSNGEVTDSYWNTELSGNATSPGGVGLTTTGMYVQGSFSGFDFDGTTDLDGNAVASVWLPPASGQHFPHLRGVSKNGQVLSIPRVEVIPGSAPFLLEHTFLPPTISGQAPVFSGDDDAVATIDASMGIITLAVGVTGGEEVTITVRRGGDSTYSSLTGFQVLQMPMVQTITISEGSTLTRTLGDPAFTLSAVADTTSGLSAFTWESGDTAVAGVVTLPDGTAMVTIAGAGTADITVVEPGNAIWPVALATLTLTVEKKLQTIAIVEGSTLTRTFGEGTFILTATEDVTSGLSGFTWQSSAPGVATVTGGRVATVTVTGAGRTTLMVQEPGDRNWAPGEASVQLTVNKAPQTLAGGSALTRTFGDPAFALTVTGDTNSGLSDFLWMSGNSAIATVSGPGSVATVTVAGAGMTTLTVREPGNRNWEEGMTEWTLTVLKGMQRVSVAPGPSLTRTFGTDAAFDLTATGDAVSGLVNFAWSSDVETVATVSSAGQVTILGVGFSVITVREPGNENWESGAASVTLSVLKGVSQISGFPESREVPLVPATFALGGTSSSGAPIVYSVPNTDVITISGGMATITGSGTVEVTATVLATANREGVTRRQTLTVPDKMNQTLTFAPLPDKRVGDPPFSLSATSSEPSLTSSITFSSSDESVATVAGFTVTLVGSGMTDITATQAGNRSWAPGEASVQLMVNKGIQRVSVAPGPSLTRTFGTDTAFDLTATGDAVSGLVNFVWSSDVESVATVSSAGQVTIRGAGVSGITVREPGNGDWESGAASVTLSVLKGVSQISGFPENREVPLVPATFALGGTSSSGAPIVYSVPNTDVITISGDMATITGSGTVEVTATVSATANREGVTRRQTLTVPDKMNQTLTFAPLPDKRVGDPPFFSVCDLFGTHPHELHYFLEFRRVCGHRCGLYRDARWFGDNRHHGDTGGEPELGPRRGIGTTDGKQGDTAGLGGSGAVPDAHLWHGYRF